MIWWKPKVRSSWSTLRSSWTSWTTAAKPETTRKNPGREENIPTPFRQVNKSLIYLITPIITIIKLPRYSKIFNNLFSLDFVMRCTPLGRQIRNAKINWSTFENIILIRNLIFNQFSCRAKTRYETPRFRPCQTYWAPTSTPAWCTRSVSGITKIYRLVRPSWKSSQRFCNRGPSSILSLRMF